MFLLMHSIIGWIKGFIDRDQLVEIIGNIHENPELLV